VSDYPVHHLPGDAEFDLVVVIQSGFYDFLDTRVVIPVRAQTPRRLDEHVNPVFEFEGRPFVLLTERLATVPKSALGRRRGDLKTHSLEISRAVDRLMTGF